MQPLSCKNHCPSDSKIPTLDLDSHLFLRFPCHISRQNPMRSKAVQATSDMCRIYKGSKKCSETFFSRDVQMQSLPCLLIRLETKGYVYCITSLDLFHRICKSLIWTRCFTEARRKSADPVKYTSDTLFASLTRLACP